MIFIRYPFQSNQQLLDFENIPACADLITDAVRSYLGSNDFSLFYNGRKVQGMEILPENSTIHVTFSLPGGKGGFGSMLRAIGAQIEKTTNREACRDLSGRRLRDINEEQRLKKWIAKEAEREAEKIKRRQARIERLKSKTPHKFFDYEYEKEISELPERISEALSEGLEKAKHSKKRPYEKAAETKLPKKSWLSDDLPLSSSDSDSDETNAEEKRSPSKKQKLSSNDSTSCDSYMSESSEPLPCSSKDGMNDQCSDETNAEKKSSSSEKQKLASNDSTSYNTDFSESSDPLPCSSKDDTNDQSSSTNSNSSCVDAQKEQHSNDSDKNGIEQELSNMSDGKSETTNFETHDTSPKENKMDSTPEEIPQRNGENENSSNSLVLDKDIPVKEPEVKEDSPIDLSDFDSISDLESLGLDRLKSALMARGLKCGGTLSDRAQRLWKVRGLQPHEYPANLLAKRKK